MSDESQPTAAKVTWNGTEYLPLADGKYDVIILGTGLKESILSGLLSSKGMKVCMDPESPGVLLAPLWP
jgi:Rab GDP dissociation inhibitor